MPTVYIWPPQRRGQPVWTCRLENNRLVLHQRFWTAQVLESNESDEIHENQTKRLKRKFIEALGAVGVFKGHRGGLVFCQSPDKEYEGECDPVQYEISATVNNDDINSVYERISKLQSNQCGRRDAGKRRANLQKVSRILWIISDKTSRRNRPNKRTV